MLSSVTARTGSASLFAKDKLQSRFPINGKNGLFKLFAPNPSRKITPFPAPPVAILPNPALITSTDPVRPSKIEGWIWSVVKPHGNILKGEYPFEPKLFVKVTLADPSPTIDQQVRAYYIERAIIRLVNYKLADSYLEFRDLSDVSYLAMEKALFKAIQQVMGTVSDGRLYPHRAKDCITEVTQGYYHNTVVPALHSHIRDAVDARVSEEFGAAWSWRQAVLEKAGEETF
ncbi:hypothetical protein IAT38_003515 [Cryptococcus sp. DSM 104549]